MKTLKFVKILKILKTGGDLGWPGAALLVALCVFLDCTKAFDFALDLLKILKTLKILKILSFGKITKGGSAANLGNPRNIRRPPAWGCDAAPPGALP